MESWDCLPKTKPPLEPELPGRSRFGVRRGQPEPEYGGPYSYVKAQGGNGDPIRISINLSSQQLLSPELLKHVTAALKSTRIVPSSLGFEVTEQTLIGDVPKAAAVLKRLRALGSYVCIDDFGTGHNTLTHLKAFSD